MKEDEEEVGESGLEDGVAQGISSLNSFTQSAIVNNHTNHIFTPRSSPQISCDNPS